MPSIAAAKPYRTVVLDRERKIRFGWSACCRFEEAYGKSIPRAMQDDIGVRLISHLVWAGLLHEEPGLQPRQVEPRIDAFIRNGGDISQLAEELIKALGESGVLGKPTNTSEDAPADPPAAAEQS